MASRTTQARTLLERRLDDSAAEMDVPQDVRAKALSAVARVFGRYDSRTVAVRRKVEAYFWAVVRDKCIRRTDAARARGAFILGAVVDDLLESGRSSEAVWDQIQREWTDAASPEVVERFRRRLCPNSAEADVQRVA